MGMGVTDQIYTACKSESTLVVCNHSGGKDSQVMYKLLQQVVPARQLVVIYSDLGKVVWPHTSEFIQSKIGNTPLIITRANKTFLGMAETRGMFASPQFRQCTSDLKRGPIQRAVRRYAMEHEFGQVINCMGLRADESISRSKKATWVKNEGQTVRHRTWIDALPIHHYTIGDVWQAEGESEASLEYRRELWRKGDKELALSNWPFFWVYPAGMNRMSCVFCIMASELDLQIAAQLMPDLYREYVELEQRMGFTLIMPKKGIPRYLPEITGIPLTI
jgi:3'-phosphoadenosine 5'-phosphosulfate sulfotransferase (PAPS reductase)/FAD synthetase